MRLLRSRLSPARWRALLQSERGVSLIASMMILASLSIAGTSAIYYTNRNTQAAVFSAESDNATTLAEAGMNFARSQLWKVVVEDSGDPADESILPSADAPATATIGGETVRYYGAYDGVTGTWTLVGEVTISNPGRSGSITRAVESKVAATVTNGAGGSGSLWDYSYSKASSCFNLSENAEFNQPLRLDGDLCMSNNSAFTGATLSVSGTLTLGNNAEVAETENTTDPITYVNVGGGCTGGSPHLCSSSDEVYADTIEMIPFSYTKPVLDWDHWYLNASPGPSNPCTTVVGIPPSFDTGDATMDGDLPTVATSDIAPNTSYTCQTSDGELSWDATSDTLTVDGTIFFDGPLDLDVNTEILYRGTGTIYFRGKVEFSNNTFVCGARDGDGECTTGWDTTANVLVLVAYNPGNLAFEILNNGGYQGGAIVEGDYELVNNGSNWGPVIADNWSVENNGGQWTPINPPPGLPPLDGGGGSGNTSAATYVLENVEYSYRDYTPGAGSDSGQGN